MFQSTNDPLTVVGVRLVNKQNYKMKLKERFCFMAQVADLFCQTLLK